MRIAMRMAVAVALLGVASVAWACPVSGRVVCTNTDTGVAGVGVTIQTDAEGVPVFTAITGETGAFETPTELWAGYTYAVTLDLGEGVLVTEPAATCVGNAIALPTYQVDAAVCGTPPPPPPPPAAGADCSPGYYKNHPEMWCSQCGYDAVGCTYMIGELTAKGATGAGRRDFAKAQIDACFGTAAKSPCTDD